MLFAYPPEFSLLEIFDKFQIVSNLVTGRVCGAGSLQVRFGLLILLLAGHENGHVVQRRCVGSVRGDAEAKATAGQMDVAGRLGRNPGETQEQCDRESISDRKAFNDADN